jgi:hypothetical protein
MFDLTPFAASENGAFKHRREVLPIQRNSDRMSILRYRNRVRKDSPAHSVSLGWKKTILVASQFFASA